MIIKGGSRAGPRQLAWHLQRRDTNERVEILELNALSDTLDGAFFDWQTMSEGTQGKKGLYHANIDPAKDYTLTPEQRKRAVDLLEQELGFQGLPRAVVLHEKHGREHLHVVWCRTDYEKGILRRDNNNYLAHERASKRLELEFGHEMVPGKHAKRDRKKQKDFPRAKLNHAEWQQFERTGLSKEERVRQITALREAADSGPAFKAALEEAGYLLAQGDRGYIVVDQAGGHSVLTRNTGLKKKELEAFMAGVELDKLPTIEEAKAIQKQRAAEAETPVQEPSKFLTGEIPAPQPEPAGAEASRFLQPGEAPAQTPAAPTQPALPPEAPAQIPSQFLQPPQAPQPQPVQPAVDEDLEKLRKALAERQAKEVQKWADFHAHELAQMEFELESLNKGKSEDYDAIQHREREALKEKHREQRSGWKGLMAAIEDRWNPQLATERKQARRQEIRDLRRRQERERKDYLALLEQTRAQEIENLKEHQAQKLRDVERGHEEETERYIREHEEARRILAELEEQRQRELEEELERNDSLRDGPPPPKLGK